MSTGFQELQNEQLIQYLEELLVPPLRDVITSRGRGHCIRIADLHLDLMVALTHALRRDLNEAEVYILGDPQTINVEENLLVSSTKLVELRNPLPDGSLRPPLLVFLPSNLQTNAEDSFNVASFEELSVADVYEGLAQSLMQRVAAPLQGYVREICETLSSEKWTWADPVGRSRYLLTAIINGNEGDTFGAALYELGLIPDFHLFDEPAITLGKISKNLDSVRKLTFSPDKSIRGRVLDLALSNKSVQNRLTQFLIEGGIEDPRLWTRQIVLDRSRWDISFDKWEFSDQIHLNRVSVQFLSTDLPEVKEEESNQRLHSLIGSQVLAPKERRKFKVEFQVDPHPKQIDGLGYFTVQIVAQEGGVIGTSKKIKGWQTRSSLKSVTLDKLEKIEFEEGWHFVRILPWTENGDPIPLEIPNENTNYNSTKFHESEPFYVIPDVALDEEPPQRAIPQDVSLEHARLKLQFTAIAEQRNPEEISPREVLWIDKGSNSRTANQESLEIKFGREGKFRIPVSQCLKELERHILSSPETPISWHLQIHLTKVNSPNPEITDWPESTAVKSFLSARSRYFSAIRSGNKELISQAADFLKLKDLIGEYAQTYRDMLLDFCHRVERDQSHIAFTNLKKILAIDTVRVTFTNFQGKIREALLIGPTHPLRALWLATWSQVAQSWVGNARETSEVYIGPTRDGIRGLVPLNLPPMQPLLDGRVFITVDNIHPFWSLYAPATQDDTRGLLGELCTVLGLPEPDTISGSAITKEILADRIERYLAQHPYIKTLTINAFNPGRATILAETLVLLQRQETFKNLRYDIRLFVPNPDAPSVGEAIEQLLSPNSINLGADAFSTSTGTHLFPKVNLAIRSIDEDFRQQPDIYPAHLSILLDLFVAEEVGAAPSFNSQNVAALHGLIQDFTVEFQDDDNGTLWRRQPSHGRAISLSDTDNLTELLSEIPCIISGATAAVATGVAAFENHPVITLGLNAEQRQLMHLIHQHSDWVFTIDRNFGIEFFDHGGRRDRPAYLVDYVPSPTASFGHRLVITSRSLLELEFILSQVLHKYGLKAEGIQLAAILEQLRSLSGRLALKLISHSTQQTEVLGLALARLFLVHHGVLSNQIIVPLDAHLELFRSAKQQADELGESISLQRTDMALFDLDATTRTIRCNLIEVKCYAQVGNLENYNRLKETIFNQVTQSEDVFRRHFEPSDRPDQPLKTRELATLLEFYLNRAIRYNLIESDVAKEAQSLLLTLEEGYRLEFTKSGLIFDFERPGADTPEQEYGIEYHRIGIDLVRILIENARPSTIEVSQSQEAVTSQNTLPPLITASFIAPKRDYPITQRNSITNRQAETQDYAQPLPLEVTNAKENASHYQLSKSGEELSTSKTQDNKSSGVQPKSNNLLQEKAYIAIESSQTDENSTSNSSSLDTEVSFGAGLNYDILLGVPNHSPQYGILGEISGRKIALDLNQTHTISLFGVQGSGKSYTLGTILEMACLSMENINILPSPLASVIFHYSPTLDYKPEFTSMVNPNSDINQINSLRDRYGAEPAALQDVVILVPQTKVEARKAEYPDIEVLPITFAASELKAPHWKFLMGAVGSQSLYLRQINLIMKRLGNSITLPNLLNGIENSAMPDHLKDLARIRLEFAQEYINDSRRLANVIRPGRLIIVDLRDEFIDKDEALGLFVVMLQIFSEATDKGHPFNKLVVFDEAHKYMESPDLVTGLIEVVREMRHKGTSIMVASQDPPSVPISLIELSSQIILHRFNSPSWLKHIQKANAALGDLTAEKMSRLSSGEAYVWSGKATDSSFTIGTMKIRCRPRVTQHGGGTKTAVVNG
jgi:DNA phosphorothioation-dependent restriction protein DptH